MNIFRKGYMLFTSNLLGQRWKMVLCVETWYEVSWHQRNYLSKKKNNK